MLKPSAFGGVGRAFAVPQFRLFWFGGLFSMLGVWIFRLALGWLAWDLTGLASWLGVIAFASTFPAMVLSPIAGAIADRIGFRKTLITVLLLNALNMLTIFVLLLAGWMTIWILLVQSIVQGLMMGFDLPSRQSIVAQLVERSELAPAVALMATTIQAGGFVGPMIFAALIGAFGINTAFAASATANLLFVACLTMVRERAETVPERGSRGSLFGDVVEGFRYAIRHPAIRLIVLMVLASSGLIRPYVELMAGFADKVFDVGPTGFAWMMAISGLGAMGGAFGVALRGRTEGLTHYMMLGFTIAGAALVGFAATGIFWIGAVSIFFAAMFLMTGGAASQSLIQNAVDPAFRGRVVGLWISCAIGGLSIGALVLGSLADIFGLQWVVGTAGVAAIAVQFALSRRLIRHVAMLEAGPPAAQAAPAAADDDAA